MHQKLRSIEQADVYNKTVLVRVDFNLPIVQGQITDLTRLKKVIPTIKYLISKEAKVVLISHYGSPKGKFSLDMSLAPIVNKISEELGGMHVGFALDVIGKSTRSKVASLKPGEVILLENVRFHIGEEQNDEVFAKEIASLGDIYVNDAFSCSHRIHATIDTLPKLMPSYAGLLLIEEMKELYNYLSQPKRKLMAVTGGSKISAKLALVHSLLKEADYLVVGGAMANTFLKAQGYDVGASLYEEDYIKHASDILNEAKRIGCEVMLPTDVITAKAIDSCEYRVKSVKDVQADEMILDVGPRFLAEVIFALDEVKTVVWNGPLGVFERIPFDLGTTTIARAIASLTFSNKIKSIAGGGDVVSAINHAKLSENFSYISTGGGAFLKWLENKTLPTIEILYEREVV